MTERKATTSRSFACLLFLIASALLLGGCASPTFLMPTPNVYAQSPSDPFADVPPALQNSHVDVMYLTDRVTEGTPSGGIEYGYKRSRAVAYGVARVDIGTIGRNVSWDELVKASRSSVRLPNYTLTVGQINEWGRFPSTPRSLIQVGVPTTLPASPGVLALPGDIRDEAEVQAEEAFHKELSARLALSPVKEVYVFVHGYANTFDDSVETIAGIWHFLGRQGVPLAYSWPAGGKGLLRGYTYDTESSEFTVSHLEKMLRVIASCPDVKKVNIICHSRGTDTTVTALRELHLEITASGHNTRKELKLGTFVMAAPDIDLDVVIQKILTVRLGQVPERFAMYVCSGDKALGLSEWLFGGIIRLGELKATMFSPAELKVLRSSKTNQIINADVTNPGDFGHNYFHANPAVSSDLVLLMRYNLPPGEEYGRPLLAKENGFWAVDDTYPKPSKTIDAVISGESLDK